MNKVKAVERMIIIGIVGMCIPMVVCTLYTYPVQDDFYNTWNVRQTMQEGHTAFGAALLMAIRGGAIIVDTIFHFFDLFF